MSNLSNIGFQVKNQKEFIKLANNISVKSNNLQTKNGNYLYYLDKSNAELWLQVKNNNLIGLNPHFNGKSKRLVVLTNSIPRVESEMDGAYYCWAEPNEENNPNSGLYPFIFDVPNYYLNEVIKFPKNTFIQLSAFALEVNIYNSEKDFYDNQKSDLKFAIQSFIPSGLFNLDSSDNKNEALGIFTGIIKEYKKLQNDFTRNLFYWFLVNTLGGEIDVITDIELIKKEPQINGVLSGQFWLSGKIID